MKVLAVRDAQLGAFMQPFFTQSIGVAVRSFADEVNRQESPMNAHPDDYELFEIGEYDEETGHISCFTPKSLSLAKNVIRPRE